MVGMHDAAVIEAVDPEFPERAAGLERLNLCPDVFGSCPGSDLTGELAAGREVVTQMGMDRFQRVQQVLSRFPGLRMISGWLRHTSVSCSAARRAPTRSRTRGATSPMKVRSACGSGGPTSRFPFFYCFPYESKIIIETKICQDPGFLLKNMLYSCHENIWPGTDHWNTRSLCNRPFRTGHPSVGRCVGVANRHASVAGFHAL